MKLSNLEIRKIIAKAKTSFNHIEIKALEDHLRNIIKLSVQYNINHLNYETCLKLLNFISDKEDIKSLSKHKEVKDTHKAKMASAFQVN